MLCDCHLHLQGLDCLRQTKLDGKLPRIKHLDISFNGLFGHVGILSSDPITQCEISWGNVISYDPKEKHHDIDDIDDVDDSIDLKDLARTFMEICCGLG